MKFDVIIIGGSYAGLSAALQLGRARKNILVVDAGERRNRFASHSHGFLGQDGKAPGEIITEARRQIERYPTIDWAEGRVTDAEGSFGDFVIEIDGGRRETADRLILAMGVADELPAIAGLKERWGSSVFHCPYCHGYELNQGKIGVIAASPLAIHHALMLPDWGETTFFTNGVFEPDADQNALLSKRGVRVETTRIREITGHADVVLADGRSIALAGLFTQPKLRIASNWLEKLGCAVEEGPMGSSIVTDPMKQTTAPGIFACGDVARPAGSVALSVGDGAMAGAAAHRSILFPE
ncbi:NAD(P)/FAD-dependent oxidoreductase [Agrobacterium salinitolerans]|uniref:Thioredoxin reductase n=1 Tax=Agrobacterium salinitolerans TaxID=1183413 RepID=A0A9X3KPW7_9HYPH|nr:MULTISPECIES: NAD(P)/FAD-dependent oxidoreductase [Agrobacterium]MCZ7850898.1 NAD(P)/FAD-dependent oxidoreductase [Agrobacterium salinitolerans]MCZ7856590.1 NAD(P)/FAD-dependent oxidoreductase [Agrobacterium salinitolerans]MCZ7892534.1 NAD(P)/FAD-dependent oxidoreductase [Agrobacterium salinitolerans]MCZ7938805.1 NAD(P)/FAD-dependent oxidoreductase [Agrobacterium salinitolerans]MCZ7974560.1 NAD(P)/FAD-dependent oxidoreductase [Agrobacterium salinitolerans]